MRLKTHRVGSSRPTFRRPRLTAARGTTACMNIQQSLGTVEKQLAGCSFAALELLIRRSRNATDPWSRNHSPCRTLRPDRCLSFCSSPARPARKPVAPAPPQAVPRAEVATLGREEPRRPLASSARVEQRRRRAVPRRVGSRRPAVARQPVVPWLGAAALVEPCHLVAAPARAERWPAQAASVRVEPLPPGARPARVEP
jgi:hypothetical protein